MHQGAFSGELIAIGLQLQQVFQQRVFIDPAGASRDHGHLAAVMEQKANTAALTEVAAVFAEGEPQFGCCAVAVVAEHLHQHRHPAWAIALVADLFKGLAAIASGSAAFGDGALDIGGRNARCLGLADGGAQLEVAIGVSASSGCHADLSPEPGEHRTPFGIHNGLGAFDL